MFAPLARTVARHPRRVLAAWLLLALAAAPFAARVGEVLTAEPEPPATGVARRVADLLGSEFALPQGEVLVAVATPAAGAGGAAFREAAGRTAEAVAALPGVAYVRDGSGAAGLGAGGDAAGRALFVVGLEPQSQDDARATVDAVRRAFADAPAATFELAGGVATLMEVEEVSQRDARRAELYGLPLSLAILLLAFGAVVAAGLPLVSAVTTVVVSSALLFAVGQALEFAVFTRTVVTMLGLATGIDYALLMVTRFREELAAGLGARDAAERTTREAGKAVAFSGLTVVLALLSLLVPPVGFIRSIGVATTVVLVVAVLVAITAVPATLALLGENVDRLRVSRRRPGTRSRRFWRRQADRILGRPALWAVAGVVVLVALALPALRLQVGEPGARGMSPETEARRVVEALADEGLAGLLAPFDVVVDLGDAGFFSPAGVRSVSLLDRALTGLPGVKTVVSPFALRSVPRLLLYQFYASAETARRSEVAPLVEATVSETGRYALLRVLPDAALTPAAGAELLERLRASLASTGLTGLVGGRYVEHLESARAVYGRFPLALAVVGLATTLLLGRAFRSLLIPLKAVLLNALTVAAAFGVLVLTFQDGALAGLVGDATLGFVDTSAPLFVFAMVFGLSMDYEVFLVSRIREGHERGLSDRDAVVHAVAATGGVITSAAAVMVTVFAILMFSHVELIKALGLGLTVAIVLDATLVRLALVPSLMLLAGRWNWWLPGRRGAPSARRPRGGGSG
ncbi:MAG TPA: MMPL family transporter [Trueperaceae bacterium]